MKRKTQGADMGLFSRVRAPMNDEDIIDLYWARDERAIDETDHKYRKYLFTIAYNILYVREDCDECLDDTYIGVWNAIPPSRPSYFKAFLTTIVRRVSINRYNEKSRQKRISSALTDSLSDMEGMISDASYVNEEESIELGRIISEYVRSLTARQRYIFMSRYYTPEPIDKIARELGTSRSTVNKEIASIKAGLCAALEKEGYKI